MVRKNRTLLTYLGFFICGVGLISATSICVTNHNMKWRLFSLIVGVLQGGLCGYLYTTEKKKLKVVEPQPIIDAQNIEIRITQH